LGFCHNFRRLDHHLSPFNTILDDSGPIPPENRQKLQWDDNSRRRERPQLFMNQSARSVQAEKSPKCSGTLARNPTAR
jgi:hypothetical protein